MKTVFIVGAGASKEANMPTGLELRGLIARALNIHTNLSEVVSGDAQILEALSIVARTGQPYSENLESFRNAAQRIRRALPQAMSIDSYIDSHSGDKEIELCGKLAIVKTILKAEAKSTVFVGQRQNGSKAEFDCLEDTWFHGFFQLIINGCKNVDDLQKRLASMVLIIFNYDRCIEQYLYHALQNYYHLEGYAAATLLQQLDIYHPYGTVGSLPWRKLNDVVPFGHDPHAQQLLTLVKQIKTFTEGTDASSSDVKIIRSHVTTSNKLVFLGFAFHRLNLELLLPESEPPQGGKLASTRQVYGTAYNISDNNVLDIRQELKSRATLADKNIYIRNELTCSKLIEHYSRSLQLG